MKIIRDESVGTLTLVPVETEEKETLAAIVAILKVGEKLSYHSRLPDSQNPKFGMLHFYAGSQKEEKTEVRGRVRITNNVYVGGVRLVLRGSTVEDKYKVGQIRDTCYFGSGGLILLEEIKVDGQKALLLTAKYCKLCGSRMIDRVSCAWSTCNECAAKCEHQYERGLVMSGIFDVAMGEFCGLCGRGQPHTADDLKKSRLEHHRAVERELSILVVD